MGKLIFIIPMLKHMTLHKHKMHFWCYICVVFIKKSVSVSFVVINWCL